MHEIRTYSYEFPHAPAAPLPSRGGVRGGVCIILHLKSYQPHPCPSPAWEGSGCATFSDDRGSFVNVLLVSHEYYARCGRWALSLRTVGTLVADERLQTSIPVTGRSSYQYFYANSNEDNAAKQLWTEMTTSHRTKTDAQPMT